MKYEMTLDIAKGAERFSTVPRPIVLRQTDEGAYEIEATIRSNGEVLDLTGSTVRFYATRPDGEEVIAPVTVKSAKAGVVNLSIPAELTAVGGTVTNAYFRVTKGETSASTESIPMRIMQSVGARALDGSHVIEIDDLVAELVAQKLAFEQAEAARAAAFEELSQAVTNLQLLDGAVTTPKIADGAVKTVKIDDDAVTIDKLSQPVRDSLSRTPKAVKESTGAYYAWIDIPLGDLTLRVGFHGIRGLLILTRSGSESWRQEYPST